MGDETKHGYSVTGARRGFLGCAKRDAKQQPPITETTTKDGYINVSDMIPPLRIVTQGNETVTTMTGRQSIALVPLH
jgi:hypothetical protein